MKLSEEIALVVGATSGIGRAIAEELASQGARVVLTGRKRDRGEAVAQRVREAGGQAAFVAMDAGDEGSVAAGIEETVRLYGGLTVLVFAAASYDAMFGADEMRDRQIHELATPALEMIFRVGVYGAFWSCKYSIPHMLKAGRGAIVMTSSLNAIEGKPGTPAYSASKGALDALTRQLAIEYGKRNIRTNTVNIGFVPGENIAAMGAANPNLLEAYLEAIPYVRGGTPEDIAHTVAFLVSADAAYINGVCLPVDGGRRVKTAAPDYSKLISVSQATPGSEI
jgi:NAD(P)-dependent dehydrogenase (short-subunit alcohol dehydrogenase family)